MMTINTQKTLSPKYDLIIPILVKGNSVQICTQRNTQRKQ